MIFGKKFVKSVLDLNEKYGSNYSKKKKYNIEFVSANPTGPLHVGHCRGAILGDVISNLLVFNGNEVIREYYVNDHGEQIKKFVLSVYYRIVEIQQKKTISTRPKRFIPGRVYYKDCTKKL